MTYAKGAKHAALSSRTGSFEEFVEPTRFVGEAFYNASEAMSQAAHRVFKGTLAKARARASVEELAGLSDHTLRDIGVSRSDIRYLGGRAAKQSGSDDGAFGSW